MRLPAITSLLWAIIGAALTIWGRRQLSRPLWVAGASLMVIAAVKLVLVDFGSLGQLANILAVIAAGAVFMLVGWLAPMPPAAARPEPEPEPEPEPATPRPQPAPARETPVRARAAPAQAMPAGARKPWNTPPDAATTAGARPQAANDYWERNARSDTHQQGAQGSAAQGNSKLAWTLVILAVLFLPLSTCSRAMVEIVRLGLTSTLAHGNGATVAPAPAPAPAPVAEPAPRAVREEPAPAAEPLPVPTSEAVVLPVVETVCSQFAARLPADFVVYAAGNYRGQPLDFTIDDSNHSASRFDVSVLDTRHDVVLALGAYEPSIWNIKRSVSTHIAGVWISGYYGQKVTGLDPGVPVLSTRQETSGSAGDCPAFYLTAESRSSTDLINAVNRVLHHDVEKLVLANEGHIDIGGAAGGAYLVQGDTRRIESFRDPDRPLAGEKGIEDLIRKGSLRPAMMSDYLEWLLATGKQDQYRAMSKNSSTQPMRQMYVVKRAMEIPADLYGAHSVTLIVPRGVPSPTGNPGHSQVLDMNYLQSSR